MDYRLTEAIADPQGPGDALHSETWTRLPGGFLCFAPDAEAPAVADPPVSAKSSITFGSFNKLAKITPEVVGAWAEVFDAVANSRMLIKNRSLADAATRQRSLEIFGRRGIDPGRLRLPPWIAPTARHRGG